MKLFKLPRWEGQKRMPWVINLIAVGIGLLLIVWRVEILQQRQLERRLYDQAQKIENTFSKTVNYTENVLRYVSYLLTRSNQFKDSRIIYGILKSSGEDTRLKEVLPISSISWANDKHQEIISATLGILKKPADVNNRRYTPLTIEKPGQLHLDPASLGTVSKAWIFPAGYGVTDKNGKYAGALVMGFDIGKLERSFEVLGIEEQTRVVFVDERMLPVLSVGDASIPVPEGKLLANYLSETNLNNITLNRLISTSFLRMGPSYYAYQFRTFPYVIFQISDQPLSLKDLEEIIINNKSEFLLILLGILVLNYLLYHGSKIKLSLSSEYLILAIIVTVLMATFLAWTLIKYQGEDKKYRYNRDATRIARTLEEEFSYVENILRFIGEKIASSANIRPEQIVRAITLGTETISHRLKILSWPQIGFVNTKDEVIVSGVQGVFPVPRSVAGRAYIVAAKAEPWELHFSSPDTGIVSGEYVMPAGFGITSKKDATYLGILSVGFNVQRMVQRIEEITGIDEVNFVLLSKQDHQVVFISSNGNQFTDSHYFKGKLSYLKDNPEEFGVLPKEIEYDGTIYHYFHNMHAYPYVLLMGENKHMANRLFQENILPRLIQFLGMWMFMMFVLLLLRMRMIGPIIELSNVAKSISEGNTKVKMPRMENVETLQLAKAILQVKRALLREKRLKQELEQAKDIAEQANQALKRNIGAITHDICSPLTSVVGFSQIMMLELYGKHSNDKYREYAFDVYRVTNDVIGIAQELLDIAKIEEGKRILKNDEIDIKIILDEVVLMEQHHAQRKNISIIKNYTAAEDYKIRSERKILLRIFSNILSNAIKYTEENLGKNIWIGIEETEEYLKIIIQDEGYGIKDVAEVVKPYNTVNNSQKPGIHSTGLGLFLVKQMIEQLHGGQLQIESQVGRGTTVYSYFPKELLVKQSRVMHVISVN